MNTFIVGEGSIVETIYLIQPPHNLLVGNILLVPWALPLRLLLRLHVLPGLSVRPVLWLVSVCVPLHVAEQPRPRVLSREGDERRQRGGSAPSVAGAPALPLVWRVQRLFSLHSGISEIARNFINASSMLLPVSMLVKIKVYPGLT